MTRRHGPTYPSYRLSRDPATFISVPQQLKDLQKLVSDYTSTGLSVGPRFTFIQQDVLLPLPECSAWTMTLNSLVMLVLYELLCPTPDVQLVSALYAWLEVHRSSPIQCRIPLSLWKVYALVSSLQSILEIRLSWTQGCRRVQVARKFSMAFSHEIRQLLARHGAATFTQACEAWSFITLQVAACCTRQQGQHLVYQLGFRARYIGRVGMARQSSAGATGSHRYREHVQASFRARGPQSFAKKDSDLHRYHILSAGNHGKVWFVFIQMLEESAVDVVESALIRQCHPEANRTFLDAPLTTKPRCKPRSHSRCRLSGAPRYKPFALREVQVKKGGGGNPLI